jgi:hypothetical protein
VNITKKQRKKSKERVAAGDGQTLPKSSEPAPAAGDVSKPPRFRKTDAPPPQLEAAHAAAGKPPMQRAGSGASVGSAGSAASQEFAAVASQAMLIAFKAARC